MRLLSITILGLAPLALFSLACAAQPDHPADAGPSQSSPPARPQTLPRAILPDGTEVTLELALTQEEISRGLMYRPTLPPDRGMLFIFSEPRLPSFWMLNTLVPLDIVFLDQGGRVIEVRADAQPCPGEPCPHFIPREPAMAVLELLAGEAQRHQVAEGSRIEFSRVPSYPAQGTVAVE